MVQDAEKAPSFWEQFYDSRLFCQQECTERCHGDSEENETYDDFHPVRMNYDDELPIASLPHACQGRHGPEMKPVEFLSGQFSLPWADLNGNQKDSTLLTHTSPVDAVEQLSPISDTVYTRHRRGDSASQSPTRSLLPFSIGSTGSSFNSLPKPRFLSGIPTKAYLYQPDHSDPIDVEMHKTLRELNTEAFMVLALRCVNSGRYEIDGRNVLVYWDDSTGVRRLLVHEDEVGGANIADMPLSVYMNLVANVALEIQRPAASGSLTFVECGAPKTADIGRVPGEDRYRAMRVACTQAKLREQDAEIKSSANSRAGSLGRRTVGSVAGSVAASVGGTSIRF